MYICVYNPIPKTNKKKPYRGELPSSEAMAMIQKVAAYAIATNCSSPQRSPQQTNGEAQLDDSNDAVPQGAPRHLHLKIAGASIKQRNGKFPHKMEVSMRT